MSEIRVTTLKDTSGSNSSTTAEIASGRAKAFVNFNGTSTVAIRANFNVNSITDNGTGDYTVNFSTALADANYCVTGAVGDYNTSNSARSVAVSNITAPTTSAVRIHPILGAAEDQVRMCVSIFR